MGGRAWLLAAVLTMLVGAPSLALARQQAGVPVLGCDESAQTFPTAPQGFVVVHGRVAVPSAEQVLQLASAQRGYPRFAKQGIYVAAGSPVSLSVPIGYRQTYALVGGVSRVDRGAKSVRVVPCPAEPELGGGAWTGRPFGYFLRKPACVPLTIRADGQTETVRLSIGRRCPP